MLIFIIIKINKQQIKQKEKDTQEKWKEKQHMSLKLSRKNKIKTNRGITLIALVITIVLNCSYLAMERMYKKEKILKIN